jgi:hypothetical protein
MPPVPDGSAPAAPAPRRRFTQWPITLVLSIIAIGLLVVGLGHFRRGCVLLSFGVVLAFFLRALLPGAGAGMLAVRSRGVDLLVLGALAVFVSVLSFWVPPPS